MSRDYAGLPDGDLVALARDGDASAAHQPTYHVEFRVKDLWGDAADEGVVVVDLFESYLDKAAGAGAVNA